MSDPTSEYGRPVADPAVDDDDLVGRAHAGLAEAEAARRDEVADDRIANTDRPVSDDAPAAEPAATVVSDAASAGPEPVTAAYTEPASDEPVAREPAAEPSYREPAAEPSYREPAADPSYREAEVSELSIPESAYAASAIAEPAEPVAAQAPAETAVYESPTERVDYSAWDTEPAVAVAAAVPAEPVSPQPIFVQAPEAPRPRGNRGAAGLIGLLAALSFGILYLAVWLGLDYINGRVGASDLLPALLAALATWKLWVPVVVFFIAFWLLGAIINRGRWGAWVIFGLLVGLASYGGHILGQLFQAPFWEQTASDGAALVQSQVLAPLAIAAFVIGRELTIWFGAWVAARGRRVTELNVEARREYERTLEAGPQLSRV